MWSDLYRLDTHFSEPSLKVFGNELGAIVRPDKLWFSALDNEIKQSAHHIIFIHLGPNSNTQRFSGIFIKDCGHLVACAVAELVIKKVD